MTSILQSGSSTGRRDRQTHHSGDVCSDEGWWLVMGEGGDGGGGSEETGECTTAQHLTSISIHSHTTPRIP